MVRLLMVYCLALSRVWTASQKGLHIIISACPLQPLSKLFRGSASRLLIIIKKKKKKKKSGHD